MLADTCQMDATLDTREAFILSRDAVILASRAFFDPSMMGLLYFVRAAFCQSGMMLTS